MNTEFDRSGDMDQPGYYVEYVGEVDHRWDEFVRGSAGASIYHLMKWRQLIEDVFGHRAHYLMALTDAGECKGLLPLIEIRSMVFGRYLVSIPFFNYGGVCAENERAKKSLISESIKLAERLNVDHLELRATEPSDAGLQVRLEKVGMSLTLKESADVMWESFPSKLRSQIRRPRKDGLTAKIGGVELLDSFYDVFSENMRDLGTPVYERRFFETILARFPDESRICAVFAPEGKPLAAGFVLRWRSTLEIPWASSLKRSNRAGANMLMYWSIIEFACNSGVREFDFGRSTVGEGTYRFKEQWGAKPRQLYWYYWVKGGGSIPMLNPSNPKYRMAIGLWKRLPVALTRIIGPRVVRNLP